MSNGLMTACERLLSATANGLYQGMLIAALAWLALRLFGRTNAATRHAVWLGTLLLVVALIPAHLLLSASPRPDSRPIASPAISPSGLAATISPDSSTGDAAPLLTQSDDSISGAPSALVAESQVQGTRTENDSADFSGVGAEPTPVGTQKPQSGKIFAHFNLPNSICLGLVSIWLVIACVRGRRIALGLADVRFAKRTSRAPSQTLQARFNQLRHSLGITRPVQLKICGASRTAMVLGFFHPVVLLPAEMDTDTRDAEVDDVLRHELAHVARRDDWANLAQQMVQCVLFFHPAVWWICPRLALEREIACDDHVLQVNSRPSAYALTLANVASRMTQSRQLLAPGVSNNNSQLKQRINMILNQERNRSTRLAGSRFGIVTLSTALLAVLAVSAGPRLVLAQTTPVPTVTADYAPTQPALEPKPSLAVAATPAALPPDFSSDDSDPRVKPGAANNFGVSASGLQPVPAAPARPPLGIVGYGSSAGSVGVASIAPPAPPAATIAPDAPKPAPNFRGRMSIEERLDRIERALEKLEARGGMTYRGSENPTIVTTAKPLYYSYSLAETKQAALDAKRAAEASQNNFERANHDLARQTSMDFDRLQKEMRELESRGSLSELQALRSARDSMRREMENMDRQIKQLEKAAELQKKQAEKLKIELDTDAAPKAR